MASAVKEAEVDPWRLYTAFLVLTVFTILFAST
jgi:hypothetical protein